MKHLMQSAPGAETVVDGRRYLYFGGTGYLGLHGHPALIDAACQAMHSYGMGTATTRTLYGNAPPVIEVEQRAARFWDVADAFYFASGYLVNHVLLSAVAPKCGAIFADEYSHYSVLDATRCFDLPVHRFRHRDAEALRQLLHARLPPAGTPVVVSDGVFAARGTIAPVPDYVELLSEFPGARLCLDDCHAVGVLGDRGRGTCEYFGFAANRVNQSVGDTEAQVPQLYAAGTLSKAFGSYGGIVPGAASFVASAKQGSHYYRGASAPPVPVAAASAAALTLVATEPERVRQLQHNARRLKACLSNLGLAVDDTPVPIISLNLGTAQQMRRLQQTLADEGILIAYSEKYAGLGDQGALRIAVFATHTKEMIETLTERIGRHL
jgi:7-keto-8-aminopelargonate synthetase-like enzyme